MRTASRLIGLQLLALGLACSAPTPEATPVPGSGSRWPVPAGWKHETFPLPPDFAPTLPYHGTEELRFMPGFSTPTAPDWWSYVFVWWVDEPPSFDAPNLEAALTTYFRGLATAVGGAKFPFDPQRFRSVLATRPAGDRERLTGQVFSHDPFATGDPITLNVEAELRHCPAAGRTAIVVTLSPAGVTDAVWTALRAAADDVVCN